MELSSKQKERIDAGAALLDKKVPDWYTKIDAENLDINSFNCCIVCQACEALWFSDGLSILDLASDLEAVQYGFYPNDDEVNNSTGTEEYEEERIRLNLECRAKEAYWLTLVGRRLEGVK